MASRFQKVYGMDFPRFVSAVCDRLDSVHLVRGSSVSLSGSASSEPASRTGVLRPCSCHFCHSLVDYMEGSTFRKTLGNCCQRHVCYCLCSTIHCALNAPIWPLRRMAVHWNSWTRYFRVARKTDGHLNLDARGTTDFPMPSPIQAFTVKNEPAQLCSTYLSAECSCVYAFRFALVRSIHRGI